MSRHRHHCGSGRGCRGGGSVKGTFRGLADAFGVSKGVVIAGFVLGWVFAPLLTTMVFLAAWYWTSHPEETRRQVEWVSAHAQRAARRVSDAAFGRSRRYGRPATEPDFDEDLEPTPAPAPKRQPASTAAELKERFEDLDRRAKHIEEVVASEEYRLEREFRRIDD